jgi:hypothetical protein
MATMTADSVDRLEQYLPKLAVALEQQRLGHALEEVLSSAKGLEYHLNRFHALVSSAVILRDFMETRAVTITEVISDVEELGTSMASAADQASLLSLARYIPDVEKSISRFHREVLAMLERYTTRHIHPLIALGRLLDRMGAGTLGQKLQKLESEAAQVRSGPPLELPKRLESLDTRRIELLSELTALAKDPDVDAFLRALGHGRTNLKLVTPTVLKWLADQGALDKFFVTSA